MKIKNSLQDEIIVTTKLVNLKDYSEYITYKHQGDHSMSLSELMEYCALAKENNADLLVFEKYGSHERFYISLKK